MNSAKAESQQLLDTALPFAKQMLMAHGEFYPYGMAMKPSGEIVSVAGYNGREHPPSQEIIDLLVSTFKTDAAVGKVKATALVYDILITDPKSHKKSDAIAVALDHRDNYSVVVFFRYSLVSGLLQVEAPTAEKGDNMILRKKAV